MKSQKFRHEIKHYINSSDYLAIRSRLKHIAYPDRFAVNDGSYTIRSLYFDNLNNKALLEKINGVNQREKFRIRLYNHDPSYIRLEKKSKLNSLCSKDSVLMTREQCQQIIRGDIRSLLASDHPLLQELYAKMRYQLLRPRTIVEYTREAYCYPAGNVRITFDSNLRSGLLSRDFFNPELPSLSITSRGQIILEVKYDEFLPALIRDIIQTNERRSTSISKYAACRIYG
jgi:hypothetical protein